MGNKILFIKRPIVFLILCLALLDTPSMAVKTESPLSSRDMIGDKYDAAEHQRYRDKIQEKIDNLESRIASLEFNE